MVMSRARLALLAVVFTALAGSTLVGSGGSGRLEHAVSGLRVTMLDGPGGTAVCGATVVATDGMYSETLAASPSGGPGYYYGATQRAGRYAIVVTFEGRTATTPTVSVARRMPLAHERGTTVLPPS